MSRTNSLDILSTAGGKDLLAEEYGKVIENIEQKLISSQLKNKDLSGDPKAGSIEAKRFQNITSNAYGTARSGGSGQKATAKPVTINIDQNKELIEEVEEKDAKLYGVEGLIAKRTAQAEKSMSRELERAFFNCAATNATELTTSETSIEGKIEALIQAVETVKNNFVDGVDRDMISVVCDAKTYGALRNKIDTLSGHNVTSDVNDITYFHGVKIFSTVYLPQGVNAIAMADGSVALPVLTSMDEPGKIPMSDAYHFGVFYYYGVKAVTEDLIYKISTPSSAGSESSPSNS